MNAETQQLLVETLAERSGALTPASSGAAELIDRAQRDRHRRTALGTIGGVAATAAAVLVAVLVTPGGGPDRPAGPANRPSSPTTSSVEGRPLSIDEASRLNAVHDWATSLPAGEPVSRQVGYRARREGDRIAIEVAGRHGLLPAGARILSSPTRVADGWLFLARRSVTEVPTRAIRVSPSSDGAGLDVAVVAEATVVSQVVVGPGGRQFAVVSGDPGPDGVLRNVADFHALDDPGVRRLELRGWQEPRIATWEGDVVTLPSPLEASTPLRSYDLATGHWAEVGSWEGLGDARDVQVVAEPGAQGGDPATALLSLATGDGTSCLHVLDGTEIRTGRLACAVGSGQLQATVSPGARYVVVGDTHYGRVNPDRPARLLDLPSFEAVDDVPEEVLAVGVRHLYWEDEDTLIGQATRVAPVHQAEALFRWDLPSASGQSLPWDPDQTPFAAFTDGSPDEPVAWPVP